jgi:5-(carboxyamino)imidazole ribonucleotide synthase
MTVHDMIPPGSTIGILGGGQLGRMAAIAARRLGYRVHVLAPDAASPAAQVADVCIEAEYEDPDAMRRLAQNVDVLTYEFENLCADAVAVAEQHVPVRPSGRVLRVAQHRRVEKETLQNAGLPVTPFLPVHSADELHSALQHLGPAAVLKTARSGYDGKGQVRIRDIAEHRQAWDSLKTDEAICEAWIPFEREVSVVVGRGLRGDMTTYGPIENTHANHILDTSVLPANLPADLLVEAVAIARRVAETLDLVGVICVEYFVTREGRLLINEIAPRPHNSGHLTIEACPTSQFEQQIRAICGLPLGDARPSRPAAMANLLGDLWSAGEPDWAALLRVPGVNLHLYGKDTPRPGRKMGHITAVADDPATALRLVRFARESLTGTAAKTPREFVAA